MSKPSDYFSRSARLLRRAERNAEFDKLSGGLRKEAKSKLTTQTAGLQSVALVREILNGYRLPSPAKLSYSGVRDVRTAANSAALEDGVVTIHAQFRSHTGVLVGIDIPIEIRRGELQEPSVIVHNGAPRVIAQSTFDDITAGHTFYEEPEPRAMYSAPFSQATNKAVQQNRVKIERVNTGMFSLQGNRRALQAAIKGVAITAQAAPMQPPPLPGADVPDATEDAEWVDQPWMQEDIMAELYDLKIQGYGENQAIQHVLQQGAAGSNWSESHVNLMHDLWSKIAKTAEYDDKGEWVKPWEKKKDKKEDSNSEEDSDHEKTARDEERDDWDFDQYKRKKEDKLTGHEPWKKNLEHDKKKDDEDWAAEQESKNKKASPEDYDADDRHEKPEPDRNDMGADDHLDPAETMDEHDIHVGQEVSLKEALEVKERGGVAHDLSKGTKCTILRDHAGDNKSFVVEFEGGLQAIVERHFLKSAQALDAASGIQGMDQAIEQLDNAFFALMQPDNFIGDERTLMMFHQLHAKFMEFKGEFNRITDQAITTDQMVGPDPMAVQGKRKKNPFKTPAKPCKKCQTGTCANHMKKPKQAQMDFLAKVATEIEELRNQGLSDIDIKQAIFTKYGPDVMKQSFK